MRSSAARACPTVGPSAPVLADQPWPQQRWDLSALGQLATGEGVTVAVVDSGVDARHPQLSGPVAPGTDELDRTGDGRTDCVGHGTAVASIIAARPLAGSGLRGLAPGVRILPVRVSERVESATGVGSGAGTVADLAAGILAAVASRPRPAVINLSISTNSDSPTLREAVAAALRADIVVVAAVGNDHDRGDPRPFPASYDGVVGVGGITRAGTRTSSSQAGPYVDIVAPGEGVVAAAPGHGHVTMQGTSFAAPFVSATAALIRGRWPTLHQAEVVRRLLATADPAPGSRPSPDYGWGVVNPVRALSEVVAPAQPAAPGAAPPSGAAGSATSSGSPGPSGSPASVGARAAAAGPASPTGALPGAAWLASGALLLGTLVVGGVATAAPLGRRRRWRPGSP